MLRQVASRNHRVHTDRICRAKIDAQFLPHEYPRPIRPFSPIRIRQWGPTQTTSQRPFSACWSIGHLFPRTPHRLTPPRPCPPHPAPRTVRPGCPQTGTGRANDSTGWSPSLITARLRVRVRCGVRCVGDSLRKSWSVVPMVCRWPKRWRSIIFKSIPTLSV